MTGTRDALEQLRSVLADVLDFDEASGWSDDELLASMGALEALGRLVDAHRAACAGEVEERSRVELGEQRLSTRRGCRSAAELVERVTQTSAVEARRRIALGSATRARSGFTGEPIAAVFPVVAAALAAGHLGADAAGTIIRELDRTRTVADPIALATAELRVQAQAWSAFLDQDGREPDDDRAMRRRGFRLGRGSRYAASDRVRSRRSHVDEVRLASTRVHMRSEASTRNRSDRGLVSFDVGQRPGHDHRRLGEAHPSRPGTIVK